MYLKEIMPSLRQLVAYNYETIQNPKYDNYIASCLQNKQPAEHPNFVQISGIPGAGKSTFLKQHNFENYFRLSFDAVMAALPDYQQDIKALGPQQAFAKWEMPARVIGYQLLQQALEQKLNIVIEHSGTNEAHLELFRHLPKLGYQTKLHFICCDIETACRRVLAREKITHRHTPKELIIQRFAVANEYLQKYQSFCDVSIYNGNGVELKQVG